MPKPFEIGQRFFAFAENINFPVWAEPVEALSFLFFSEAQEEGNPSTGSG